MPNQDIFFIDQPFYQYPMNIMKALFILGFLSIVVAPICTAQTSGFAVESVTPSRAILYLDGAWQRDTECLKVRVSVLEEVTDPVLKAHFYGADGTLLHSADKPPSQGNGKGGIVDPTTNFEKDKKYEVFFGIPKAAEKWRRVIFVFGKPGEYAASVYPADDLARFDFPEKAAAAAAAGPTQTAQTYGFAVDLISPSKAFLFVDDVWQRDAECLKVKVSVTTDISDPVLKAYLYDADRKLLETVKTPTRQTNPDASQVKPQVHFEKAKKYEVYFGIPVIAKNWKRAIVVFGNPGEYATKIYPKDDLAKFDFPENELLDSTQRIVSAPQSLPRQIQAKSVPELQALRDQFEARVKSEVQQTYTAGVKDLNARYATSLERAQVAAQQSGKLEEAVALKADKDAVISGRGVPAVDDARTPPVLIQLRGTYRVAIGRLEVERGRRLQPLQTAYGRSLDALVTSLTKEGKLEEAMAVKSEREKFTAAAAAPAPAAAMLGQILGEAKTVLVEKAPASQLPELWTWHLRQDIGPSGTILFKKDGTVEQKINGRTSPTFGTWKATDVPGVLNVTLGNETCAMTVTGSDAVFDASFGRRYLKVSAGTP